MKKRVLSMALVLCMILALLPTAALAAGESRFADVSPAAWYRDAVEYVDEKGWMTGTSPDTFSPETATSRGMLATILYRMDGSPAVAGACPFDDVTAGRYYEIPITWAAENDIVTGYSDSQYGPDDPVTREQIVTILYRFVLGKNYDTTTRGDLSSFVDAGQVSAYAADAMGWAVGADLVFGVSIDRLAPAETATRAQFAAILSRLVQYLETAPLVSHTVIFQYNYTGKGEYQTAKVEYGGTVAAPAAPSRRGYSFTGWYTKPAGGEKFDFAAAITDDLTLYAHWRMNSAPTYTLTYDANGGTGAPSDSTKYKSGAAATLDSATTPTHENDADNNKVFFVGWTANEDAKDNIYGQGDKATVTAEGFLPTSVTMTADTTVYAVWSYDKQENNILDCYEPMIVKYDDIEYYVLHRDVENNKQLILARTLTDDVRQFNSTDGDDCRYWCSSTLRTYLNSMDSDGWLNGKTELQAALIETTIKTRHTYNIEEWNDSADKVFPLSEADVFGTIGGQATDKSNDYTIPDATTKIDAYLVGGSWKTGVAWWLRSPSNSNGVLYVNWDGNSYSGTWTTNTMESRPACWVKITSGS